MYPKIVDEFTHVIVLMRILYLKESIFQYQMYEISSEHFVYTIRIRDTKFPQYLHLMHMSRDILRHEFDILNKRNEVILCIYM